MKEYIERCMKYYSAIYPTPSNVVEHMFATNGNGIQLNQKGYLNENYRSNEVYPFGNPEPYAFIYPWSKNEEFQPFRKLAGCRDIGFKETAQYFIDCIKCTPDDVKFIKEWKENIHIVEDVLLNTPPIQGQYTIHDMEKFLDDIKDDNITLHAPVDGTVLEPNNSVKKVWYFDVQWSDCPNMVEDEVRHLWNNHELGNDYYMYQGKLNEEFFNDYPKIYFWLKHKGVPENEQFIIHWWW